MTPLEQMLRAAAADAEWPATPDLAPAVMERLAPHPRRRPRPRIGLRRSLALAFAALLLLAGSALAIPAVRDWLGLSSVEVKRVPRPLPAVPGARLSLGTRVPLDAARAKLGFAPLLPSGLGDPTVYYEPFPPGGQLGLAYRGGILMTEVQGRLQTQFLAKFLPPGTAADRLAIDGEPALWIHGSPHQYAYADRTGQIRTDSVRTAGDVLLWRRRGVLVRIEGARSKQRAVAIARSARATP
jgi:hypothetical protein